MWAMGQNIWPWKVGTSRDLLLLTLMSRAGGQPAQGPLSIKSINNMGLLTEPNAEQGEVPPNVHPHGSRCLRLHSPWKGQFLQRNLSPWSKISSEWKEGKGLS